MFDYINQKEIIIVHSYPNFLKTITYDIESLLYYNISVVYGDISTTLFSILYKKEICLCTLKCTYSKSNVKPNQTLNN